MLSQASRKYKSVKIQVQVVNEQPFFTTPLPAVIFVNVTRFEDGSVSPIRFEYESPKAIDPEKYPIRFKLDGNLPSYLFLNMQADFFKITLLCDLVQNSRLVNLNVLVGDALNGPEMYKG